MIKFFNTILFDANEQFEIYSFFFIANVTFYFLFIISIFYIINFFLLSMANTNFFLIFKGLTELIKKTVKNNITDVLSSYYNFTPFFNNLFFFILISNLMGLLSFTYTVTSLLLVPFFLSFICFLLSTIAATRKYGFNILGGFLPEGTSLFIAPLLIIIEIISYFIKLISLAVRLFANMFAGHVLIKVLLSLMWTLLHVFLAAGWVLALAIAFLILAIFVLELFICCLQAYVFVNLASVYMNQACEFLNH